MTQKAAALTGLHISWTNHFSNNQHPPYMPWTGLAAIEEENSTGDKRTLHQVAAELLFRRLP